MDDRARPADTALVVMFTAVGLPASRGTRGATVAIRAERVDADSGFDGELCGVARSVISRPLPGPLRITLDAYERSPGDLHHQTALDAIRLLDLVVEALRDTVCAPDGAIVSRVARRWLGVPERLEITVEPIAA